MNSQLQASGVAALAGVATHLAFFIRGEHHRYGVTLIKLYAGLVLLLGASLFAIKKYAFADALIATLAVSTSYLAGLYSSILIYRAFLHPLRKFKGPFRAKLSNIFHAVLIRKSDNYLHVTKMHEKYGPIVRIGPANLSINTPDAVQATLGSKSKCTKSPWYEQSLPVVNLHTSRDKKVHERRRKVFSKAFSPAALRDYEVRVVEHAELLTRQLARMEGKPFDATAWFKYFAFDVMGELGFGETFGMLSSDENRWLPDLLERGMSTVGWLSPIPWFTPIFNRLPLLAEGPRRFLEYVGARVEQRAKSKSEKADILSYLLEDFEKSQKTMTDYNWLRGDTRLVIVGGSDTTAATLTYIYYHLAKDPSLVDKLRAELMPLLDGKRTLDPKDVASAKYLNGVIHEALRLHPPIPSGYPRLTPPEGVEIGGHYIPGNTTVTVPLWTIGRSEEVYARASEFIPERWYSQPELIKQPGSFASFSLGPYSCIGRELAIMEMRTVITNLLCEFDTVEFAPGEDGSALIKDAKDHFTVGLQPFKLCFKKNTKV